jgi:primosomal protein N' (replication factor Y)
MNVWAEVVFPLPIARTFSYAVPPSLRERARIGVRVTAPFGRRQLTGFLVHLRSQKPSGPGSLKEINDVLDEAPLFSPRFLAFTRRLTAYHYSAWGELLQASLPPSIPSRAKELISLTAAGREALDREALTASEKALASLLIEKPFSPVYARRRLKGRGFSSLLSRMAKKGLLEIKRAQAASQRLRPEPEEKLSGQGAQLPLDFSFGPAAQSAASAIQKKLEGSAFSVSYLFGPSAVREAVYVHLIRTVLAGGGRTLVLVPEISPSAALMTQFELKLGERAAVLHSRLTDKQRETEWRRIRAGRAAVVIGPRSALLAPIPAAKLMIIDEEQDESFLQSESPAFDARQGILFRARADKAAAVLGSASPSVSWYYRAESDGCLIEVGGGRPRPRAEVVDMTREQGLLSRALEQGIRNRLARRETVLIFLNRKGYASLLVCPRCRHMPKCLQCDIPLTYHKRENKLTCRYCRYEIPALSRCPRCGEKLLGGREPGIEALEEDVRRKFPGRRVACFDTDVTARRPDRARVLEEAVRGQIDILLGTQLLAHQANLPPATLVGILNPEALLSLADYRAGQKAFQGLIRMLSAAAVGNREPAEVIIQTAMPDHHSIRCAAAGDFSCFFKEEIIFRRLMNYPPFSCMAEVLFQGQNLRTLAAQVRGFHDRLRSAAPDVDILGSGRAAVTRVRGLNRLHLLVRAKKKERLDAALSEALKATASVKAVWLYD